MEDTDKKLCFGFLSESFPDTGPQIACLYNRNATFFELCEHYFECCEAVSHWRKIERGRSSAILEDYVRLQRELEQEIIDFLLQHKIIEEANPEGSSPSRFP